MAFLLRSLFLSAVRSARVSGRMASRTVASRTASMVVLFVSFVAFASQAFAADVVPPRAPVTGVVVTVDGSTIPEARLELVPADATRSLQILRSFPEPFRLGTLRSVPTTLRFEARSGRDGSFRFASVPSGLYRLRASAPGYRQLSGDNRCFTVVGEKGLEQVRVELEKSSSLAVLIVSANEPVAGATVELIYRASRLVDPVVVATSITGSDGRCQFSSVPVVQGKEFEVVVDAPGRPRATSSIRKRARSTKRIALQRAKPVTVVLDGPNAGGDGWLVRVPSGGAHFTHVVGGVPTVDVAGEARCFPMHGGRAVVVLGKSTSSWYALSDDHGIARLGKLSAKKGEVSVPVRWSGVRRGRVVREANSPDKDKATNALPTAPILLADTPARGRDLAVVSLARGPGFVAKVEATPDAQGFFHVPIFNPEAISSWVFAFGLGVLGFEKSWPTDGTFSINADEAADYMTLGVEPPLERKLDPTRRLEKITAAGPSSKFNSFLRQELDKLRSKGWSRDRARYFEKIRRKHVVTSEVFWIQQLDRAPRFAICEMLLTQGNQTLIYDERGGLLPIDEELTELLRVGTRNKIEILVSDE